MDRSRKLLVGGGIALLCAIAAAIYLGRGHLGVGVSELPARSYEAMTGSRFLPLPGNAFQAPAVRELDVPPFADATGIWGATGRDDGGGIWIGVSAQSAGMSAHLMRYDPATDTWQDRGAVTDRLREAGVKRDGEGQVKIHSKIIPADDGWLYFASMDEEGESAAANKPPRWGGHLWRVDPGSGRWEHLMAAPEGLIAATGVGRHVYALGYWGHVLYRYDTASGATKRTVVGSVGGHVTRNILADVRGHVYVPRLEVQPGGDVAAALVEFDADLREVAATPLDYYVRKRSGDSGHGIIGLAYLADGRIAFTTHRGHLYLVDPTRGGPASVTPVGWFHPLGEAYAPSLFSFSGKSLLAGVTQRAGHYEWVVFDLATAVSAAFPLDTKDLRTVLLYGSVTRDDAGRFYVVGWAKSGSRGQRPLVLQITPAN